MDFEENIRIGKRIAALRKKANLTQTDLAERLGKPQSYISKIESGERAVHLSEIVRLAESMQRKPSTFVYYVLDLKKYESASTTSLNSASTSASTDSSASKASAPTGSSATQVSTDK